jgi:hypothetical protein
LQVEALLEEMMLKLSSVVSDLFGSSGRRILKAIAAGEDDPVTLARLGDERLKASNEELQRALKGRVHPAHRLILGLYLIRALSQSSRTDRRTGSNLGARD